MRFEIALAIVTAMWFFVGYYVGRNHRSKKHDTKIKELSTASKVLESKVKKLMRE